MINCGVDEAGRGALAGKVYAAAVILNPHNNIIGLCDSKTITFNKREKLFNLIIFNALSYSIASATVDEIDKLNILQATLLAMKRAIYGLKILPDIALIDGIFAPKINIKTECIIKGDAKIDSISAASILAKVARDKYMITLNKKYPEFHFAKHKGYGTKHHFQQLSIYGASNVHRKSFTLYK